jgi:two-component system response regulator FixJ
MKNMSEKVAFVLDSNAEVRASAGQSLGSLNIEVVFFIRQVKCLEQLRSRKCDLLIVDSKVDGMDSIDLIKQVAHINPWVPVIVITDRGDVTTAVRAIRAGAVDVIEKPLDKERLKRRVDSIMRENVFTNACVGSPLTRVETRVLKLVIGGKTNKEMAHLLDRSVRTIEWHRANLMEKLGVESLLGLIKRAAALGIVDLNGKSDMLEDLHDSG